MLKVGQSYFFMTVTHYYVGTVREVSATHAIIDNAAWVADTGRLSDCLKTGEVKECEPVLDGWMVPLMGTAVGPWPHKLPLARK